MSLIGPWIAFPVLLAAVGAGWGAAVERAAGLRLVGVLVVPLGLAAAIVVASLLTAFAGTAPAATPVVAIVAAAGLVLARPFKRVTFWPALTALGVLLAYGAPVLLSGSATFGGYFRLDDTATWLGITDHVMTHGRSVAGLPPSTYSMVLSQYLTNSYPLGGFMLLGIGHALTGIDSAWIYQPYLSCCGAAVGLCVYALVEPIVDSPRLRTIIAFLAAQPALLYGYAMWGGIKELTAAFLLALGAALFAQVIVARPQSPWSLLPLSVVAAALIVTLGAGAAAWVVPALVAVVVVWALRAHRNERWAVARDVGLLSVTTAVLAVPMWVVLSSFLATDTNLYSSGQPVSEKLGTLLQPLSGWQVVGIWPVGDFRLRAPTVASALFIGLALVAAGASIWVTVRRRQFTIVTYVALALVGCAIFYLVGSTPWVVAKALAIASPALLAAALVGGAVLRRRSIGLLVLLAIGGGVIWSNVLAYHDVALAPRAQLTDLQHIGGLIAGKGPTLVNQYEWYADRHFLREGAPVEAGEHHPGLLTLDDGVVLSGHASADLDSFQLSTLEAFRSIVTRRSPAESRPPSIYQLIWQGNYYQLWQRPAYPSMSIVEHVPLGESNQLPYCGAIGNEQVRPLCSANPVAVPPCTLVHKLAATALRDQAQLVAYQRAAPIVVRGDQSTWPATWLHEPAAHELEATQPWNGCQPHRRFHQSEL